jgi:tetratricopeptide (TPR) repeat protein
MSQRGMDWRPKREQSWALFALAGMLAVVALLPGRWKGPPWAVFALAVVAAVGGLWLTRLQAQAKQDDERAGWVDRSVRTSDGRGGFRSVRDLEVVEFGVHPAHVAVGYIDRDKEVDLLEGLRAGRPVLVVGHSMAGKTRMAARVLMQEYPDRPICIPVPPDGLAQLASDGLPQRAVVWLDDMDRFLTGDGLRVEWLDRMLRRGNVIVATMRAKEHEKFQPAKDVRPPQAELLERFTIVRLKADAGEQQRIAEQITDPRTREGVQRYGLAEYVGAGHLAVDRFETGESQHPLGAAMVRAAVDWHRVGLDAIPATSLAALAPRYLPQRYRHDPGEDTETATEWANERVEGIYRLLEPTGGGYRAFDYILDYLSRAADPVPECTWREAAASAPADRAMVLAYRAYLVGHTDVAGQLWQSLIDSGQADQAPIVAFALGVVRREQGDLVAAAKAYQVAVDSGHADYAPLAAVNLGLLREKQGDLVAAAKAFQVAVDSGHADQAPLAAVNLGLLREEQGDLVAAAKAFQVAVDSGQADQAPKAAFNLGLVLKEQGDLVAAAKAYQVAIDSGHADYASAAAFNLWVVLKEQGDLVAAAKAFQVAVDSGHADQAPKAAFNLGLVLKEQGDLVAAATVFQVAVDSGHADYASAAAFNLGLLLKEQGDLVAAAKAYQVAIDSGHADYASAAAVGLGLLLEEQGDLVAAATVFQVAIDSGHVYAAPMTAAGLERLRQEG